MEDLLKTIVHAIEEKKGYDILVLDMRPLNSGVADFWVLCSADSDKQAQAIADNIREHMRNHQNTSPIGMEGYEQGRWILIDYAQILIHIFQPAVRAYYNLEELWGDAPILQF